ncbi:MAG: hypothetical protein J0L92_33860 [Deltaproteobacteria bacterium]|nr:hypothetical protein [Deltaproteobacteria bacterium]
MTHRSSITCAALAITLLASGCWYEPVEVEGRACATSADCIDGYRCEARVCVLGAPMDAGVDAAAIDAALVRDAGPDAPSAVDAPLDAGEDGGTDAGPTCEAPLGAQVAMGGDFGCAIVADEVVCWGNALDRRTGFAGDAGYRDAGTEDVELPTTTVSFPAAHERWAAVTVGEDHACALACDRTLYCWGRSNEGQLGVSDLVGNAPVEVGTADGATGWDRVAAGWRRTCAYARDSTRGPAGAIYCWGSQHSQSVLGLGSTDVRVVETPTPVTWTIADEIVDLDGHHNSHCAITAAGVMRCWGHPSITQTPPGSGNPATPWLAPLPSGGAAWTRVAVGAQVACALATGTSGESLFACWGSPSGYGGFNGLLGPDHPYRDAMAGGVYVTSLVTTMPADARVEDVAFADRLACAMVSIGGSRSLRCWGRVPVDARFPPATSGATESARPVGPTLPIARLSGGQYAVCATTTAGQHYCYGRATQGGADLDSELVRRPP